MITCSAFTSPFIIIPTLFITTNICIWSNVYMYKSHITNVNAFICKSTIRIKWRPITVNVHYCWSYFTFLIIDQNTFQFITTKRRHCYNKIFLINPKVILYHTFSLNTCECLRYHQLQSYCNQHWNHRHIHLIQSFSYYLLKTLFKCSLDMMELLRFQGFLL